MEWEESRPEAFRGVCGACWVRSRLDLEASGLGCRVLTGVGLAGGLAEVFLETLVTFGAGAVEDKEAVLGSSVMVSSSPPLLPLLSSLVIGGGTVLAAEASAAPHRALLEATLAESDGRADLRKNNQDKLF